MRRVREGLSPKSSLFPADLPKWPGPGRWDSPALRASLEHLAPSSRVLLLFNLFIFLLIFICDFQFGFFGRQTCSKVRPFQGAVLSV